MFKWLGVHKIGSSIHSGSFVIAATAQIAKIMLPEAVPSINYIGRQLDVSYIGREMYGEISIYQIRI